MSERVKGVESPQNPSRWRVPELLAVCEAQGLDSASIILRRHGNPMGPRLVLSHANGFSADSYYPFWSLLCSRFDLVLYDIRNHGRNPVGDLRTHHMTTFARDNTCVVEAIDRHFGGKPKVGGFHSMSAVYRRLQGAAPFPLRRRPAQERNGEDPEGRTPPTLREPVSRTRGTCYRFPDGRGTALDSDQPPPPSPTTGWITRSETGVLQTSGEWSAEGFGNRQAPDDLTALI